MYHSTSSPRASRSRCEELSARGADTTNTLLTLLSVHEIAIPPTMALPHSPPRQARGSLAKNDVPLAINIIALSRYGP